MGKPPSTSNRHHGKSPENHYATDTSMQFVGLSRDWGDANGSDITPLWAMSGGRTRMGWVLRLVETETDTAGRGVDVMDLGQCQDIGDIATLADGRKFSCPKLRACPGQVLTIREWTFEPDRLLIASIHNGLDRRELGALRPLGGKKANEERVARSVEAPTESVPTTVTPLASSPEAVPTSNPPTPPPVATPDSSPPQRTRQFSPRLP